MSAILAPSASTRHLPGTTYDALVIGGGLAGPSLAIRLAKEGRQVVLIEKSAAGHPKVCGEFLSHEALHYLAASGLDVVELGAVPIDGVRLVGREMVAQARLPFTAYSLSRGCLDEALLRAAQGAGVTLMRSRRVEALTRRDAAWTASAHTGETIRGCAAFLATGKHDLRGWARPPGRQHDLVAFKMHWRLAPREQAALQGHVELILFPGGYAGLQPVEAGAANLCLLVRKQILRQLGGSWETLLPYITEHSAHLAARLRGAIPVWARPLCLSSIPYGYLRRNAGDGLWRLGDQSAVIPSFAGDGMSIALHSASLAAMVYLGGGDAEAYQRRLAQDACRQVGLATLLSQALVRAWTHPALYAAARLWPAILAQVAASTRLAAECLVR